MKNDVIAAVKGILQKGNDATMEELGDASRLMDAELEAFDVRLLELDKLSQDAALDPDSEEKVRNFFIELETVKTLVNARRSLKTQADAAIAEKLKSVKMAEFNLHYERAYDAFDRGAEKLPELEKLIDQLASVALYIIQSRKLSANHVPISPAGRREFYHQFSHLLNKEMVLRAIVQKVVDAVGSGGVPELRAIWPLQNQHAYTLTEVFSKDRGTIEMVQELYPYGDPNYPGSSK